MNIKNNIVLAATDFHDVSEYAVLNAIEIAKRFEYKIVVAHVHQKKKSKYSATEIIDRLKGIISDIKQKHGIDAEYVFTEGDPLTTINQIANDIGANYLIIGSRGKTGVEYVFGSYAAKIVQNSEIPVMVVKNHHPNLNFKNIVIPLDHFLECRQLAKWAILFAKRWNSNIHLFMENPESSLNVNNLSNNVNLFSKIFDENRIPYFKNICPSKKGDYSREAIKFAIDQNADLILSTSKLNILIPAKFSISFFSSAADEEFIEKSSQIPYLCVNPKNLNIIVGGL